MKKLKHVLVFALMLVILGMPFFVGCTKQEPKIEISEPFKTEYFIGEQLDVTGGILDYTDENGKTKPVIIEADMIEGFVSSTAGTRKMLLTYKDISIQIQYTVKKIATAQDGVIYYAPTPEVFNAPEGSYFCVIFNSDNTLNLDPSTECPTSTNVSQIKEQMYSRPELSYQITSKTVVDGQTKYVVTTSVTSITFTAIDDNTINVYGIDGAQLTFNLTKFVV